jgi:endonuclease/exonuclease/phosphatase family metal-dependent hydrolase
MSEEIPLTAPRTAANSIRFATYNLLDYGNGDPEDAQVRQREQRLVEVIAKLDVDVLAVQEVLNVDPVQAARRLAELGEACGLSYQVGDQVALAPAASGFHVGLLWRPGIEPVRESWRAFGAGEFWHALATLALDVGGPTPVTFAAYHADPFRPQRRFDEAFRVASLFHGRPVLIGADWNNIGAERKADGSYYDIDPYTGQTWFDELIHQTRWSDDPDAPLEADRRAGELLRRSGLFDAAAVLDADWEPTTGYWPGGNRFGPRRTDAIRVTRHLLPALKAHWVARSDTALATSDHLPAVVEFEPARIEHRAG